MDDMLKVQISITDFDFFDLFLEQVAKMINDDRIDEAIRKEYRDKFNAIDTDGAEEIRAKKKKILEENSNER
ncbi:MAG: hypothetical protein Q8910_00570 [Bacteroidota bacterium]|nr:hypothetical protein [Bacteroidota bacterium]